MAQVNLRVEKENENDLKKLLNALKDDECVSGTRINRFNPNRATVNLFEMNNGDNNNYSSFLKGNNIVTTYMFSDTLKMLIKSKEGKFHINAGESTFINKSTYDLEINVVCACSGEKLTPYRNLCRDEVSRTCTIAHFSTNKDLVTVFLSYKDTNLSIEIERKYLIYNLLENKVWIMREPIWSGKNCNLPEDPKDPNTLKVKPYIRAFHAALGKINDYNQHKARLHYGLLT